MKAVIIVGSCSTQTLFLVLIEFKACASNATPPSVWCLPVSRRVITLLCVREPHWRNARVDLDVLLLSRVVGAARRVPRMPVRAHPRSPLISVRSDRQ